MGIDERTFSYLAAHSVTFLNRTVTAERRGISHVPERDSVGE